jgi:shikimate dehydrogenase
MVMRDGSLPAYPVVEKTVPTFYFIGVKTGTSAIMKVFPRWAEVLGRPDIVMEGIDLKIHDTAEAYRAAVAQIKYDPLSLGALVTTHKIDLFEAARDMFDYADPYAEICGEISSISKQAGRLEGHAKDPITAGLSLDAILGEAYFARTGGTVLCFGAGGSAVATLLHLINKRQPGDRPKQFVMVNRSPERLARARQMVERVTTDIQVEYLCNQDPRRNDELMGALPAGSVVINATGMGKDIPGSPITHAGTFPYRGVAWEFNYRGELDFLHQALAQQASRQLKVEDGWVYFLHGWTQVIAQVLHVELGKKRFEDLRAAAESLGIIGSIRNKSGADR